MMASTTAAVVNINSKRHRPRVLSDTTSEAPDSASERNSRLKAQMKAVADERCRESFSALFDHFAPLLRAYSLAREPGASLLADELAQDVLIKVWNKAHTYNPDKAAVSTWIFTLARNSRIDYLRRNGRFSSDIDPNDIFDRMEDAGPSPFQLAQQQRTEARIHDSMKELPVEQSQVLAKVYLEGKSHQETANELALPLGTVKSRVRLALQKLELLLKR